jgi:DNA-binding GntR family transcriptional regulator
MVNERSAAMLDPESVEPLYVQLAVVLAGRIADGTYRRRVPSIFDLSVEFGVARNTAHKALVKLDEWRVAKLAPGRGYFTRPGVGKANAIAITEDRHQLANTA